MRASTVFALALALLIGLAAAAAAKYAGLFNRKETPATVVQPPPQQFVLVPVAPLYADVVVLSTQVGLRPLRPEEERQLVQRYGDTWREKLLPANQMAAHQRIPNRDLVVDQLLFREYFLDTGLPDPLSQRLDTNTRAVNVSVPKEKAGGGQLQIGEYVDVLLTTRVSDGEREQIRTAPIAHACKIVMKRNNLWRVPVPEGDGPLSFTLQANLYRAALIEHAMQAGTLSLQPVPNPPKFTGSWSRPDSKEYATEDRRIEEILRGERTVGDDDLARIFSITPAPPRLVTPPQTTEHYVGVSLSGVSTFPSKPVRVQAPVVPAGGPNTPGGTTGGGGNTTGSTTGGSGAGAVGGTGSPVRFGLPSATGADPANCPTCGHGGKPAPDPYRTVKP